MICVCVGGGGKSVLSESFGAVMCEQFMENGFAKPIVASSPEQVGLQGDCHALSQSFWSDLPVNNANSWCVVLICPTEQFLHLE